MADAISNIDLPDWLTPGSATPLEVGLSGIANVIGRQVTPAFRNMGQTMPLGGGRSGPMVVLAPVFLDSRDYMDAGGEFAYQRLGERLRELQGGM